MRRRWESVLLFGIFAYFLWIFIDPPDGGIGLWLSKLLVIFPLAAAAVLAWRCARIQSSISSVRYWIFIAAGFTLWSIGDLVRFLVLPFNPTSAFIERAGIVFSLLGYVSLLTSWVVYPMFLRQNAIRLRLMLDVTISTGSIIALTWLVFLLPVINSQAGIDPDSRWLFGFPVLDSALLGITLNILLISSPGKSRTFVWYFLGGMIASFLSDYSLPSITQGGIFLPGTGLDTGMLVCGVLMLLGVLSQWREPVEEIDAAVVAPTQDRFGLRIHSILPLALALALVFEMILFWQSQGDIPQEAIAITVLLWLLLIARQGVAAGEFELRQYAVLFEETTDPAFIIDHKHRFVLVNPAFLTLSGYPEESHVLGRPISRFFILGIDEDDFTQGEALLTTRSGDEIPVDLSLRRISPLFWGKPRRMGSAHDLSTQKHQQSDLREALRRLSQTKKALEQLNNQLEQKVEEKTHSLSEAYDQLSEQNRQLQSLDQLKSDFISLVSHELRAPLTTISGGLELLLAGKIANQKRTREYLTIVREETIRLTRFVESILDLSALEAGKMPLHPTPVSISQVIRSVRLFFTSQQEADRLVWNIPEGTPDVLADTRALESIFFHVIDNGLKYTQEGNIEISCFAWENRVFTQINDQGPGIPEDVLPMIFEKFYRLDNRDSQAVYGHGLGLYIVRRLLQAQQGDIKVENRIDGGATFTFWLPKA